MAGLVSISFRQNTVDEIIAEMKKCGLSCVEWGSDVHAPQEDEEKLKEVKKKCDENNISCVSYGTYFRIGKNSTDEIMQYIKAAKILGTKTLRIWCGTKSYCEYTAEEKTEFLAKCKVLADIAEKEDVLLCMECHNRTFTEDLEGALLLMDTINSPNFRMYWQPNQYKKEEQNIEYAKKIKDYVEVVHVFNWEAEKIDVVNRLPLVEAKERWQGYFDILGKKPALLEFMPDNSIESLANEAAALKEILGE